MARTHRSSNPKATYNIHARDLPVNGDLQSTMADSSTTLWQPNRPVHEDVSNSYFLSSGDHSRLLLVFKLLNGPNFQSWKRVISMALAAKNKTVFVDNTLSKRNSSNPLFSSWTSDYFNQEQVLQFLTGLNESYNSVRAQILLLDPLQSLSKVFAMVVQEERQRTLGSSQTISIASTVSNPSYPSRNKKPRPTCSHCNNPGHLVDKCFFLPGFPPGYGDKKKSDRSNSAINHTSTNQICSAPSASTLNQALNNHCQQLILLLNQQLQSNAPRVEPNRVIETLQDETTPAQVASNFFGNPSLNFDAYWVIDSGATHHICHDSSLFHSFSNSSFPPNVVLPNGETIAAHNIGIVHNKHIILTNVLYVPNFRLNLFSVNDFLQAISNIVSFTTTLCIIQAPTWKLEIETTERLYNLYIFKQDVTHVPCTKFSITCTTSNGMGGSCMEATAEVDLGWQMRAGPQWADWSWAEWRQEQQLVLGLGRGPRGNGLGQLASGARRDFGGHDWSCAGGCEVMLGAAGEAPEGGSLVYGWGEQRVVEGC
ncbi:uncharacterized protein LOC133778296 [Humulus lupulus]|uniref:uncharacterized protein LOC133778296 n=1 Tax=Humulus lupulus TaxID=3486 RepID=UPI002B404832|nr:uncharacterized protein LOC133778296 [Humulus lupulus]